MSQSPVGALILGGRRCYEYKISLKYKGGKNKTKKTGIKLMKRNLFICHGTCHISENGKILICICKPFSFFNAFIMNWLLIIKCNLDFSKPRVF